MTTDTSYKRQRTAGALDRPFDAIVIGSGAGGLTAAALLSLEGQRVLVLERHATIGGCTQVFKREGFEWDAGLHYMGEVHRADSGLARLFNRVTSGQLQWAPMPEVYNRIVIGDRQYEYVSGRERFKQRMKEYFPREATAIDRYVELVLAANRAARDFFGARALPEAVAPPEAAASFMHYGGQTVMQVLRGLTQDDELIAVLCGHYGDYSLLPNEASFAVHAMLIKHYLDGASYPIGGSGRIPETISRTITDAGGLVLASAEVQRVIVRGGRAAGVTMADGTVLEAPVVIGAGGIAQTLGLLDDGDAASIVPLRQRCAALPASQCYLMLNIGLDASNAALAMDPANLWWHPSNDYQANLQRYLADPQQQPFPLDFLTQPSAKDPSWPDRYPGRSTIDLCSLTDWSIFAPFAGSEWMRRGAEYDDMKARTTERMLQTVYRFFPQTRGHVVHTELATPLSFNHFLNRRHGDFMSLAQTPDRFAQGWMRAHSPVKGLYFSGQDVVGAGVSGAMIGGLVAASAVLRRDLFATLRSR